MQEILIICRNIIIWDKMFALFTGGVIWNLKILLKNVILKEKVFNSNYCIVN